MKKYSFSHLGFTLVELIVGVTISMILMVSVGVFVGGGMQNIFLQQKVFENSNDFTQFNSLLQLNLNHVDGEIAQVANGLAFKSRPYFGNGGYTYIGTSIQPDFYCSDTDLDPLERDTNHLFIKNFVPYFESGENNLADIYTSTAGIYTAHAKRHIVEDNLGNRVVGVETFGDKISTTGTGTFLNNPTGLALSGSILFIADTLNDRILAYNSVDNSILELLDETDGLNEPTGLFMSGSSLLIANSGNSEILEYSSRSYSILPDLNINFDSTQNNISNFSFEILDATGVSVTPNLTQADVTPSSSAQDFFRVDNNIGEYLFVNYGSIGNNSNCNIGGAFPQKIYNAGSPINCTRSGSGQSSFSSNQNLDSVGISAITGLTASGSYYAHIELSNGYTQTVPYFVQGDDNLLTKDDNTLEVLDNSSYIYPNAILGSDVSVSSNVRDFDINSFSDYSFSGSYDSVLETPIKNFGIDISINGGVAELLTLTGSYYKSYDCYNPDSRVTRDFIWKKNLK